MKDTVLARERQMSPCMAKLDRLGWSVGFSFQAYGARVGVRSNDPELLERLRQRLPSWAREDQPAAALVDVLISVRRSPPSARAGTRNYHMLYLSIRLRGRTLDLDELVALFESEVHFATAVFARRCVFIHAGCVSWQGRVIAIPGRSMAGKSTLVSALVQAGAEYFSDEYAVIDSRGRVHPYHKTISLRGAEGTAPRQCSPEELGGRAGRKPLPLGLVASLTFEAGASGRLRPLTQAESAMELLANAVSVRLQPERTMRLVQRATAGAQAVKGKRGEAIPMARRLLRRSQRQSGPAPAPKTRPTKAKR
jgi:hypothetical protein